MNDTFKESLSALLDDEASELEVQRIVVASDQPEVRQQWAAMNQGQQWRRDGQLPFAELDISARVMAELADDAAPSGGFGGWKQAVSGLAVAASVAAVVVFGSAGSDFFGGASEPALASASSVNSGRVYPAQGGQAALGGVPGGAQLQTAVMGSASSPISADEEARQRFELYLRRHTDRAALNNGQGVMSYVRVVSQKAE